MENIRNIILRNRFYIFGFLLFFLIGLSFLLYTSKSASFLYLNGYHNSALDTFFILYTNLGDGVFTILLVVFLLGTKRHELAWQLLAAFIISGLIAQVFKNCIYSPRPKLFFAEREHIYLIQGVTRTGTSSFPSGHTASIFALVTILALFAKNKKLCPVYLLPAILVAYSRIYLSQHFLGDVLAGSLLGVLVALLVYYFFNLQTELRKRRAIELETEIYIDTSSLEPASLQVETR
jgi:membrane-associated phospholipid phosphatase